MSLKMKLASALMIAVGVGMAGAASAAGGADAPTTVAEGDAKDFGCGKKGQKPCPMQGWMKTVMQTAMNSGDAAKITKALEYIAAKPPPGMPNWVKITKDGIEKAKKGDIDGAKESCKVCHDAYKSEYKAKLRDLPF